MTGSLHTSVGGSSCRSTVNLPCALTCRCIPPSLLAQAAQGVIIEVLVISVCSAESCSSVAMSLHLVKGRLLSQLLCRQASGGCKQAQDRAAGIRAISQAAGRVDEPWVTATPRVCLHDVPTTLRAGGLSPHTPVTLAANLTDENGKEFCSCAHYVSDGTGGVDVRTASAVGGSYTGVFPAGLLTTLTPAPNKAPFIRLIKRDTSLPWKIKVSLLEGHQPRGSNAKPMAKVEMERHLMAPGVRRRLVREGRVRGALYLPPGEGPFPGVIDMFGSIGGLMEFRSAMLASRGFASLALATFAYDDLPPTPEHMDMEYFEEAVEILLALPEVIPDRCGAIAVSKYGDILMSMATLLPAVKAVVCINGSTMLYGSRITYRGKLFREGITPSEDIEKTEPDTYMDNFKRHFTRDHRPFIPVEEAGEDTHFLIVEGEADPWIFDHTLPPFQERMLLNNKLNFEIIRYPGAGHLIEPPYGPHISKSYHRITKRKRGKVTSTEKIEIEWGGQPQPTCTAQEDLWFRMRTFLMNHVREESPWYQQQVARRSKL